MVIEDRNARVEKPVARACLQGNSNCKASASAEINGCEIKFTFSSSSDEESLVKALEDLRNDYIGKSIMR